MSYRPYTWAVPGIKQKMRQSPSPYMFSAKHMNITQPLSRASTGAEWVFQQRNNSTSSGNNKLNNSASNTVNNSSNISSSPASSPPPQQQQRKNFSSYYYQFPKIPRPKRNVLYYSTWSKGSKLIPIQKNIRLPNIIISRRSISNANQKLKSKTKSIHNRFFSVEARRKRQQRRRFIRWWTMTSLAVVIGGVAAKIRYDRGDTGPRNQYQIKPQSWHLYAYSTLPLKAISRLWGKVNSIDLPVWMRSPAYRFYSACFGVNLDEMAEPDLTSFRNLSEFFYRTLKPGVRPIADSDLVSPSDGKVLGFGAINNGEIEQVKGMTYSIEALLGLKAENLAAPSHSPDFEHEFDDETILKRDSEFAELNGITYHDWIKKAGTLPEEQPETFDLSFKDKGDRTDSKTTYSKQLEVAQDLAPDSKDILKVSPNRQLFFAVIYLAPGDYHRYHSPANWVTTLRRHFIGELFSVAPFFQKTLQGLFVLNERVALLGYWKYGFFSMIPVGATNVGSIVVNFDKDLKTNERYENEVYSKASADETTPLLSNSSSDVSTISSRESKKKKLQKNTVYEATYSKASNLLGGYPLSKGQEVGGFKLGSTVVLVFEAPDNFKFNLSEGQKVKMGQSLGGFE